MRVSHTTIEPTFPTATDLPSGANATSTGRLLVSGAALRDFRAQRDAIQAAGGALFDVSASRVACAVSGARALDVPEYVTDYRRMLDRKDIDAIAVVTPVESHHELTMASNGFAIFATAYPATTMGLRR